MSDQEIPASFADTTDLTTLFLPANPLPDPDRDGGPIPVIDPDGPIVNPGKPGHHHPPPMDPAVDPAPSPKDILK